MPTHLPHKSLLSLVALPLLLSVGSVRAESIAALVARAEQARSQGDHDGALRAFSEAYGAGGAKELLLDIGQTYLALGQPAEAKRACNAYLRMFPGAVPALRAAAEHCLQEAANTPQRPRLPPPLPPQKATQAPQPVVQAVPVAVAVEPAQPPQPPAPIRPAPLPPTPGATAVPAPVLGPVALDAQRGPLLTAAAPEPLQRPSAKGASLHNNPGLAGAGLTMLLCAWFPTPIFAALSASRDTGSRVAAYSVLALPIVGPFVSGIWVAADSRSSSLALQYTLPWIVTDGFAQVAGLTMLILGTRPRPTAVRSLAVMPYVTGSQAGVVGTF